MQSEQELAALFAKLGARDPESWAHSQIAEGIPQLARFLFLRQAWRRVTPSNDTSWIDGQLMTGFDKPGGAIAPALSRALAAGASREDLTTIARTMQWKLLHGLCYLLSDPSLNEGEPDLGWGLFLLDEDGNPVAEIGGLHESVLETDPDGREMRPVEAFAHGKPSRET